MHTTIENIIEEEASYAGVRMNAEEFFALGETDERYELVHGVILLSPTPTPKHQKTAAVIFRQLANHVDREKVGDVFFEIDVCLGPDLVYCPEIVYIRQENLDKIDTRIRCIPDLVVEVISPHSRRFDSKTKKDDYEAAGVGEFWLMDPRKNTMTFYRLKGKSYAAIESGTDEFVSEAVPGFRLDLNEVRKSFQAYK